MSRTYRTAWRLRDGRVGWKGKRRLRRLGDMLRPGLVDERTSRRENNRLRRAADRAAIINALSEESPGEAETPDCPATRSGQSSQAGPALRFGIAAGRTRTCGG